MSSRRAVVEVDGLRNLRRTLKAAQADLGDMKAAHGRVASIVARAATPRTPVGPPAKGHIREDVRAAGQATAAVVRAGRAARPYGRILHHNNPWIYDAAIATQPEWLGSYTDDVQQILNKIQGVPGL